MMLYLKGWLQYEIYTMLGKKSESNPILAFFIFFLNHLYLHLEV